MRSWSVPLFALAVSALACSKNPGDTPVPPATPTPAVAASVNPAANAAATPVLTSAEVGKPAPDFTLPDVDGKSVSLASFHGKTVVLEWFNPHCPFVRAAHTKGSLKGTAEKHAAEGVVWLAINSSAPGKEGAGADATREAAKTYGMTSPLLLDPAGTVGHAYGATNTPNLFVIDKNGNLAYAGAIDNSPDGEGESPQGGPLVNYVDAALQDLAAGKPVRTPKTKAYGCSVKYGPQS